MKRRYFRKRISVISTNHEGSANQLKLYAKEIKLFSFILWKIFSYFIRFIQLILFPLWYLCFIIGKLGEKIEKFITKNY